MDGIIAALISSAVTGALTLVGVIMANGKNQAVTETKLSELTREVREHNNFAKRMPVVEEKIESLETLNREQMKATNRRLDSLERNR